MKDSLNILVVEDRDDHFADFQQMLATIYDKLPVKIEAFRANTLSAAMVDTTRPDFRNSIDGVITDLFFPDLVGGDEKPNGVIVVELCLTQKIPVVVITSTFHHGEKTHEHSEWCRQHGLEMFDSYPEGDQLEAAHKPWLEALFGVIALVIGIELGEYKIDDMKILSRSSDEPPVFKFGLGRELNNLVQGLTILGHPVRDKMLRKGFARIHEE